MQFKNQKNSACLSLYIEKMRADLLETYEIFTKIMQMRLDSLKKFMQLTFFNLQIKNKSFLKQYHIKINNCGQISTFVYLLNIDTHQISVVTRFKRILSTTISFIHNYLSVKKQKSLHPMLILVAGERNITCNYIMCIFFIRSFKLFCSRSLCHD